MGVTAPPTFHLARALGFAPALCHSGFYFYGFKHDFAVTFAVILEDEGTGISTLAPSTETGSTASTTAPVLFHGQGSSIQKTAESSTDSFVTSYGQSETCTEGEDGQYAVVLWRLSKEKFLLGGVLRSMRSFMDLVITIWQLLYGGGRQWQDPPKTPRRRSQSRPRGKGRGHGGKHQGKGKGKAKNSEGEYSQQSGSTPWQQSSALQTLGVTAPDMSHRTTPQSTSKQVEGVINGLRAHLKSLGHESSPEVEAYLAKCLGTGPQVIKQASQRLEASGKSAAKLKVELAQLNAGWEKFQKQVEEYQQQKTKFMDRKMIQEALQKAEEYAAAQEALREAAANANKSPLEESPQPPKPTEPPPEGVRMEGTPKRRVDVVEVEDDKVLKRLKSPIHIAESPKKEPNMEKMDF